MKVDGKNYRTIWLKELDLTLVCVIDQRQLPHRFVVLELKTAEEVAEAIKNMTVRGAGLIGAAAGYGMYLATLQAPKDESFGSFIHARAKTLKATRPTAVNLTTAIDRQLAAMQQGKNREDKIKIALRTATEIADEDAEFCRRIGEHGLPLIEEISIKKKGEPVNILTH